METSLFLAKVFGGYLLVLGVVAPLRRKELIPAFAQLAASPPLVYLMSVVAFVAGLVLVASHNVWDAGWPLVITILSWLVLLEGLIYLLLPFDVVARVVRYFNTPPWYLAGGAVSVLLGAFLAGKGFGVW